MSDVWCFSVEAEADPCALPRMVEVFALHGLVPRRLDAAKAESDLLVDVQVDGCDADTAARIAARLGKLVSVTAVVSAPRAA